MASRWAPSTIGSNGSTPSATDFTLYNGGDAVATALIQSNKIRVSASTVGFDPMDVFGSGAPTLTDQSFLTRAIGSNPIVAQFYVAGIRCGGTGIAADWTGSYPTNGYFVEVTYASNFVNLRKTVAGTSTQVGAANVAKTFTAGTAFWCRLEAIGTTIRWRIWNDGTQEPSVWDDSATDSTFTSGKPVFSSQNNGAGQTFFDVDQISIEDAMPRKRQPRSRAAVIRSAYH